jgi:hypothetical protein
MRDGAIPDAVVCPDNLQSRGDKQSVSTNTTAALTSDVQATFSLTLGRVLTERPSTLAPIADDSPSLKDSCTSKVSHPQRMSVIRLT